MSGPSPRSITVKNLRAGRNIVIALAGSAVASKFAGRIQDFFEEYLLTEQGSGAVPFGGRDQEFTRLDDWLDDAKGAPRFVLTAPAGRGKSALLVRWIKRLEEHGRVGRAGWQLVFVPISMRFKTNRPAVFYEAIAARLAEILGQELKPAHIDPAAYYEDHCRLLLDEAIVQSIKILLIIDGVDEALGECFDASWFPRAAGASLRLLVSARLLVGDRDVQGWVRRLVH